MAEIKEKKEGGKQGMEGKIKGQEIPTGKLEPFEGSEEVISRVSEQRQYIPEGATKFKDVISGEVEEVKRG